MGTWACYFSCCYRFCEFVFYGSGRGLVVVSGGGVDGVFISTQNVWLMWIQIDKITSIKSYCY